MELAAVGAGLAFLVLVGWLTDLRLHPFARCWACGGKGKNRGSTLKRYGTCGRCKGTGRRTRVWATVVRPELKRGK